MILFRCRDKDGVAVFCYRNTWVNHIVAAHPEIDGQELLVQNIIENPDEIYQDSRWPDTLNVYNLSNLSAPFDQGFIRVCVRYEINKMGVKRGFIKTAFHSSTRKKGDFLVWKKQ